MPLLKPADLSEGLKKAILDLRLHAKEEDSYFRWQQLKCFKRNNQFWHGVQSVFWAEDAQDWRVPTHDVLRDSSTREDVKFVYDFVTNVYKAHGEALISALSSEVPGTRFAPHDADNPIDIRAKSAADDAVEHIQRYNKAKLLLIHALFLLCNEGFLAGYIRDYKNKVFGTVMVPRYGRRKNVTPAHYVCPQCGAEQPMNVQQANIQCPQCGVPLQEVPEFEEEVPVLLGEDSVEKSRPVIDVFGPLDVKVPSYAKSQQGIGYLVHFVDLHYAEARALFTDLADKIGPGGPDDFERVMRSTSVMAPRPFHAPPHQDLTTLEKCWFRPSMYNIISADQNDVVLVEMRTKFPDGLYAAIISDEIAEVANENLDSCWRIGKGGPSKGVHADPLLGSMVQEQEIRNALMNLLIQSVEYGIPSTFADPEVLDFDTFSKQEAEPGFIYPTKTTRPGQRIEEAFFTLRSATFPKEAVDLIGIVDRDSQFVVGDTPSIYGGAAEGSKTLGEYSLSRSYALQRLAIIYDYVRIWWGELMYLAVQHYKDNMLEDESFSKPVGPDAFRKVTVKAEDLKGAFELLEPETETAIPVSIAQQRGILLDLFKMNSPEINSVIASPLNAAKASSIVGLTGFKIPGEDQRVKQLRELMVLIAGQPQPGMMEGQFTSSVPIEEIDDNEVHMEVVQSFLIGDLGAKLKDNNPTAYANCILHFAEHKQAVTVEMMQAIPPAPAPTPGGEANAD